jgi:hypothetical protein
MMEFEKEPDINRSIVAESVDEDFKSCTSDHGDDDISRVLPTNAKVEMIQKHKTAKA